jgi:hypothetical protein
MFVILYSPINAMSGSQYVFAVDYGTATPGVINLTTIVESQVNCNLKIRSLAEDASQCWAFLAYVLKIIFFLDMIFSVLRNSGTRRFAVTPSAALDT